MRSRGGRGMMCGLAICAAVAAGSPLVGLAGPAATSPSTAMAVLGNDSSYRAHFVFKTPVLITPDGQLKVPIDPTSGKKATPIGDFQSPLPPADWMKPAFDDSRWDRHRAPLEVAPASATVSPVVSRSAVLGASGSSRASSSSPSGSGAAALGTGVLAAGSGSGASRARSTMSRQGTTPGPRTCVAGAEPAAATTTSSGR